MLALKRGGIPEAGWGSCRGSRPTWCCRRPVPAAARRVADSDALCARCWSAIRFIEPPLCPVYGTPFAYDLGEGIVSAEALADPPPFRRARSAAIYGDVARRLVHQLKYHDRPHLAQVMAIVHAPRGRAIFCRRCVAHRARPALPLAGCGSGASTRRPCSRSAFASSPACRTIRWCFERIKPTPRQVGLSAAQREENVRGAFRVPDGHARARSPAARSSWSTTSTRRARPPRLRRGRSLRGGAAAVDVLTFARVVPLSRPFANLSAYGLYSLMKQEVSARRSHASRDDLHAPVLRLLHGRKAPACGDGRRLRGDRRDRLARRSGTR